MQAFVVGTEKESPDGAPVAGLNYILFDENYQLDDWGFISVSESALQPNEVPVPHEVLQLQAVVSKAGYAYIFLSNDNDRIVDVFFDDFSIEHRKGRVVQADGLPCRLAPR